MLAGFENLTPAELDQLLETPVLITALIGAADGKFDRAEKTWSERLVRVHTYDNPVEMNEFYRRVAENFVEKVDRRLAELPLDAASRNAAIAAQLETLNPILAKLDVHLGAALYKSFVGLAEETAKASGGFLRIGAISDAEHRLVKLSMLTPIEAPIETERPEND